MKESYLNKAFEEAKAGRGGNHSLQRGIDAVQEVINREILMEFNYMDYPITLAVVSMTAAFMRKDADETVAKLADRIKSSLETEKISIDVSELERQADELKRSKDGKNE